MDFQGAADTELKALQSRDQFLSTLALQRCPAAHGREPGWDADRDGALMICLAPIFLMFLIIVAFDCGAEPLSRSAEGREDDPGRGWGDRRGYAPGHHRHGPCIPDAWHCGWSARRNPRSNGLIVRTPRRAVVDRVRD